MAPFTRTASGILNAHLFYGTDAVVFLEGGPDCYTFSQVCANQTGELSQDMHYWTAVFGLMMPDKSVRFRAVGSKSTLRDIAAALIGVTKMSAVVAMDADVDRHTGSLIQDPHVLYTWGYSWETDLASPAIVAQAALSICPVDKEASRIAAERMAEQMLNDFFDSARLAISADVMFLTVMSAGVFDRRTPEKYVSGRGSRAAAPKFERRDLLARVRRRNGQRKARALPACSRSSVDVRRDCYGHLLARVAHQATRATAASYSGPDVSFDVGMTLLVAAMRERWAVPALETLRRHHGAQFTGVAAAL